MLSSSSHGKEIIMFNSQIRYHFHSEQSCFSTCFVCVGGCVDRIYHIELEIKDTTYTGRSASYLDLHLGIDMK